MRDGKRRWLPLILAALVVSCSEDPTEENALLAPLPFLNVAARETTITATSATTFRQYYPMNSSINLVGKSGDYTAISALAFYSNFFPVRDTVNVLSGRLTLRAASFFGDSTAPFGFTVHRINRTWTAGLATWDSLQLGFYDPSLTRGTYSGFVGADTEKIVVDLDTAMVREWLRTAGTDNADTKYGIVLVPTPGTNVVRGFYPFEADSTKDLPTLEIIAANTSGTVKDTALYTSGIDTFFGNNENVNTRQDLMYLQAGILYRTVVKFDVGFIPKGSAIHLAELLLERDPLTSKLNRFSGDRAFNAHAMVADSATGAFESSAATGAPKSGTDQTYAADVHTTVQSWVRGPNHGLMLRVAGEQEFRSFDLLTFYGPTAANAAQRPRIRILYSTPQN
ncbi:MAG: hypothetical protein H6Q31_2468 [Bacteroidetes bacterium]|jgi:hypothetical protein|nr:hypothetical protein [Bacteroidota bacterium]